MSNENTSIQNITNNIEEVEITPPKDCKVRFHNDDFTTMDFVVNILLTVFHKPLGEAEQLMEKVHKTGSAIVGVYPYDIAVTRAEIATKAARNEGFPLRITVEE